MIDIRPLAAKPPFQAPDGDEHYCNRCGEYKSDFFSSYVDQRIRKSKECVITQRRGIAQDPIKRLRIKLYKSLHSKGAGDYARVITDGDIRSILQYNRVQNPILVRRVVPPKSHYGSLIGYRVELYVESRTASA